MTTARPGGAQEGAQPAAPTGESTPAAYFEAQYRRGPDPWHLAERWYEQRKYDLTAAALPRPRYRSAFEPGCSVGELTRRLAGRCDALLAADRVASAVETTRQRTAGLPGVTVRRLTLPDQWPDGSFDLIVLSELLYYFDAPTVDHLVARATASLEPGGTLVTVHWNHPVPEHLGTGDDIAERLARVADLHLLADHREDDFVLQIHARALPDGRRPVTPAEREGLV
ncbi:Nodulation protein S (NodS) [Streptomyces sp. DvalAA-14]|uniref:class I SAM-dependent methyltransferase n=1 Tax=unclassified Streptomyces TaxID=2593676 RepID=UPI00081B87FB|nr:MULTISPECIES: SAM-dependent methyltransferase [unclassified Streptomyces]MYS19344.1 methyltransferase domain-containing protein [Streptomyces sp. SID4948]SCD42178.1 Nodulation protein S (NodS) [Streptomyces sp. DvalAA-14]